MNTPRERDRAVEQWLERISAAAPSSSAACLDAETAAAWADGSLAGGALETARVHVADCTRCQALMATLLETAASASVPVADDAAAGWRRWLTWGVPIAAAATALLAVAVWVSVPGAPTQVAGTASAPSPAATDRALPATQPELKSVEAPAELQAAPPSAAPVTAPSATALESGRSASAPQKGNFAAAPQPGARAEARQDAAGGASAALEAQAAGPQANAVDQPAPPPVRTLVQPPPPPAAPSPSARARVSQAADATSGAAALRETIQTAIIVASPVVGTRWRLLGSTVERTTDDGVTWSVAQTGTEVPMTAGSAPAAQVCWLVGRGGVVLLTSDGTRWSRLTFPATVDLVGVSARDANAATVTAADGRVFATDDGGRTWGAVPQG